MKKLTNTNYKELSDDFDNNDINEETQENLKKYYENLDKNGEIEISYRQNYNSGTILFRSILITRICLMK